MYISLLQQNKSLHQVHGSWQNPQRDMCLLIKCCLHFFAGDFHMLIPADSVDKYFFTNFTFELVVNNCPVSHQVMAQNFMSRLWIEITFLAIINDFFFFFTFVILWRRIFIFVIFMRIGQAITKQLQLCQFCWNLKKIFRYFILFSFSGWQSSSLAEGFSWAISLNAFFYTFNSFDTLHNLLDISIFSELFCLLIISKL